MSGPGWGGHPRLLIRQGLAQLGGSSQLVVPEATAANLTAFTIPVNHFRLKSFLFLIIIINNIGQQMSSEFYQKQK